MQESAKRILQLYKEIEKMYSECGITIENSFGEFKDVSNAYRDSNTDMEINAADIALKEFKQNESLVKVNISTVEKFVSLLEKEYNIDRKSVQVESREDGSYTITGKAIKEVLEGQNFTNAVGEYNNLAAVVKNGKIVGIQGIEK